MAIRYTHFEADDAAAFVADGHSIKYLGTGGCEDAPMPTGGRGPLECVGLVGWWCCMGLFFALAGLFFALAGAIQLLFRGLFFALAEAIQLLFRGLIVLLLPLLHELVCLGGAAVLVPLGACGRWLASAVELVGYALSERSVALCTGRRVLDALRGQPRAVRVVGLNVSKHPALRQPASTSTALAVRAGDQGVE